MGCIIGPVLRILDRLILKELLAPLLIGIGMFCLLTISSVVVNEAARFVIKYQLPASYFLKLVLLASPQFIILSIPMGVLLGTLLSVGRLSSDLEITALRTCGVSLFRVMAPFFVVGVLLAGLTFLGSERVIPYTNTALTDMKNDVVSGATGKIKQERVSWPIRSRNGDLQWLLIAANVEGTKLENVKLFYFDPTDENSDFYITADMADWHGSRWKFYNVRQVMLRPGDEPLVSYFSEFNVPDFTITPQSLALRSKTPDDLTILQLRSLINDLLAGESSPTDKDILEYRTKLYLKYAIPLTPLFFVFIAVPLGIMRQRTSNTLGMGIALLVVLAYYVLYTVCTKMGAAGVMPPFLAAWLPNSVLLIVGGVALWRREYN